MWFYVILEVVLDCIGGFIILVVVGAVVVYVAVVV